MDLNVLAAGPSEKGFLPIALPHGGTVLNMISYPAFECLFAAKVLQEAVHVRAVAAQIFPDIAGVECVARF